MDTRDYTIPYVTSWAANVDGKEPAEIVRATGERVRATAMKILDQLDTQMIGDGTPPGLDRTAGRTNSAAAKRTGTVPIAQSSPQHAGAAESRGL